MAKQTQHDFTKQSGGLSINQVSRNTNGTLSMMGFGLGIKKNHTLIMNMNSGRAAQFKVMSVGYLQDPPDMWTMNAKFEGYVDELAAQPEPQPGEALAA